MTLGLTRPEDNITLSLAILWLQLKLRRQVWSLTHQAAQLACGTSQACAPASFHEEYDFPQGSSRESHDRWPNDIIPEG